jgi:protocatechuate 3,4-dioxygenase beta subunit
VHGFRPGDNRGGRLSHQILAGYPAGPKRKLSQAFAANTDSAGHFEIEKITPGRDLFSASHPGYLTQQYQAKGMSGGAMLTLAPGQEVNDALFRLVRAAVVTGRVVDESGEPMARVAVTALRKPSAEEREDYSSIKKEQLMASSAAATDDRGQYRIFGLKPDEYYVKAAQSDYPVSFGMGGDDDSLNWSVRASLGNQYASVFYPGVIQVDQAQSIVLGPGEEVIADFAMWHVKTVQVAGHVIAANGRPASRAYLELSVSETGWSDDFNASTSATGEFSIKGVPPGSYVLSAVENDTDVHHRAQQKIEVGNENLDSVVITFGKGTTIRGQIVSATPRLNTLDRIRVHLQPTSDSDTASFVYAKVKQDGSFQIDDVLDDNYALEVYGMEQGWYVKSARMGAKDVVQDGLEVEKGSSGGTLEIVLSSSSAQLEGEITSDDKPVAGAKVWAKPDPETPYNRIRWADTLTDQNGHFIFNNLAPGKYKITARMPSVSPAAPATTSEAKTVTLGEHDRQAVQLTLAAPRTE